MEFPDGIHHFDVLPEVIPINKFTTLRGVDHPSIVLLPTSDDSPRVNYSSPESAQTDLGFFEGVINVTGIITGFANLKFELKKESDGSITSSHAFPVEVCVVI